MDGNGGCLAALAEDVMRSADVLERPAMLPRKLDEVLAVTERLYSLRGVRGKRGGRRPVRGDGSFAGFAALAPQRDRQESSLDERSWIQARRGHGGRAMSQTTDVQLGSIGSLSRYQAESRM